MDSSKEFLLQRKGNNACWINCFWRQVTHRSTWCIVINTNRFTFTFLNRAARNNPRFWRPFTNVTNLSYGKGTANQTPTRDKIQDKHTCISFAFKSLRKISEDNGFSLVVLGKKVHVKVWIHFSIGDTKGNNKWLGQYPGNKEGVQGPYHDCKCRWQMLSHVNPNCEYLTLKELLKING